MSTGAIRSPSSGPCGVRRRRSRRRDASTCRSATAAGAARAASASGGFATGMKAAATTRRLLRSHRGYARPAPGCSPRSTRPSKSARATNGSSANGCVTCWRTASRGKPRAPPTSAARPGGGARRSPVWCCTSPGISRARTACSRSPSPTCPTTSVAPGATSRRCSTDPWRIATASWTAPAGQRSRPGGGGSHSRCTLSPGTTAERSTSRAV